jgi:hypothetical protein
VDRDYHLTLNMARLWPTESSFNLDKRRFRPRLLEPT